MDILFAANAVLSSFYQSFIKKNAKDINTIDAAGYPSDQCFELDIQFLDSDLCMFVGTSRYPLFFALNFWQDRAERRQPGQSKIFW